LTGRITFVSEPVPGNQHDMAKLEGSEFEMILKLAGDVIDDKGFIGTDYIITPVRKPKGRDLYMTEHDYNRQISSLRGPVERAIANLKTWRILFTDYRRPLKILLSSFRATIGLYFIKEGFCISLFICGGCGRDYDHEEDRTVTLLRGRRCQPVEAIELARRSAKTSAGVW
jgi:DDE superfamily endonuclease